MKKISKRILLTGTAILVLTLYSCNETAKKDASGTKAEPVKAEANTKTETNKNKPVLEINLPKINGSSGINDVVSAYKSQIGKVESALSKLQKKEIKTTLFNTPNTPVTIWYSDNKPVKITYGVTDDSGAFDGVFTYYLKDGKLWFSDQIFAKYIFQDNKLKYWLDENWNENDIPAKDFKDREKSVLNNVNTLLGQIK